MAKGDTTQTRGHKYPTVHPDSLTVYDVGSPSLLLAVTSRLEAIGRTVSFSASAVGDSDQRIATNATENEVKAAIAEEQSGSGGSSSAPGHVEGEPATGVVRGRPDILTIQEWRDVICCLRFMSHGLVSPRLTSIANRIERERLMGEHVPFDPQRLPKL